MENKTKGRPPKPAQQRKRLQYSVWVSVEEKKKVDAIIEAANMSASQFFLTLAINKPFERPKKKTLPKAISDQMVNLEKLSGLLALSALKTKDKPMIAENWQLSSQNVRWIIHLTSLWIFSEFDMPELKKNLKLIEEKLKLLYWKIEYQPELLKEIQEIAAQINQLVESVRQIFDKQYNSPEMGRLPTLVWLNDFDVHEEIQKIKNKMASL